jgi:exodeoxyribonuclease VII small subunit
MKGRSMILNDQNDIKEISFEKALAELQEIVRKIETGQESLEAIIKYYERGNALKNYCETKLREAKLVVEKIVQKADGSISTEEGL